MTGPAPAAPEAPAGDHPRSPRRSPADLPIAFADGTLVDRLVTERGEPGWLRDDRLAALEKFAALPVESNRLYTTYVDLRAADLFAARPLVRVEAEPPAAAPGSVPEGAAGIVELDGERVLRLALGPEASAAGVILETLAGGLARDPAGVAAALTATALPADDKLAWLSRAAWSQGIHLRVPAGVRLDGPIVLRWLAGDPATALLSRTLIRLDDGAEVSVLEEQVERGDASARGVGAPPAPRAVADGQSLVAGTTEITLGSGARLRLASIQDLPPTAVAFQQRVATVGRGADLHWAVAQLGSRLVRSRIDNRLEGDGGTVEQVEIVFGGPGQLFDLTSYTRHLGLDTTGNLLSKAVLAGGARAYMKGLISIERSARGTDSFLGEYGMLLDRHSRSVTIPSLEIDQPDCRRAGHSSSVGPIDPAQVFYLMSRGISEDDARRFITLGFLEPVVARVPLEEERERLWAMLEAKWADSRGGAAAA
ncbi:MAG: SufD family Fe-S cluster assembly protein [Chloroflexi bacterium]|jgi:Fe-S cluster assembly protein SufD|nr:SufD family Fe-S cluster assembly protein [Chloroflexota bacterium]